MKKKTKRPFQIILEKTTVLDSRVVFDASKEEAEKRAMKTFHKYDLNDAERVAIACPVCDSRIENCLCDEDDIDGYMEDYNEDSF